MNIDFSTVIVRVQEMITSVVQSLPNFFVAIVVFIIFILLGRGARLLVISGFKRYRQRTSVGIVLGRLTQWLFALLGVLAASAIIFPSIAPADVLGVLGIGSVAVGFAFRDILQNFLAGIILLLTEPFHIGDQIMVNDFEGTVEEIETRATMIRTYDGRRVVIPNSSLFSESVMVNTGYERRRVEYDVQIGYGDNIDEAKRLILDAITHVTNILTEPAPDIIVIELADYGVTLRVRWWIAPPRHMDALDTRDQVLTQIKEALLLNGIDLPFPTHNILFHDQTDEFDGDRSKQREGWPAGKGQVPQPARMVGK